MTTRNFKAIRFNASLCFFIFVRCINYLCLISKTPTPSYYAFIFNSERMEAENGYYDMANQMHELLKNEEGRLVWYKMYTTRIC